MPDLPSNLAKTKLDDDMDDDLDVTNVEVKADLPLSIDATLDVESGKTNVDFKVNFLAKPT